MSGQVQSCRWCDRLAKYVVSSIRRRQMQSKALGGHPVCGRHLTRAVDYVTVPGGEAHVGGAPVMRHIDYSPDRADVENTAYLIEQGVIAAQAEPHGHNTIELVFKNRAVVMEVIRIEHFDA